MVFWGGNLKEQKANLKTTILLVWVPFFQVKELGPFFVSQIKPLKEPSLILIHLTYDPHHIFLREYRAKENDERKPYSVYSKRSQ